jgi:hypothetical protein
MNRDRAYNRKQRARHIRKRLRIAKEILDNNWYAENHKEGYLAKYNFSCNCPYCSPKTRNKGQRRYNHKGNYSPAINYKHSDAVKVDRMNRDLQDFES